MDTATWYRWFAEHEARGSSPQYERLANLNADNDGLLGWLSQLPRAKRQPNLLFASRKFVDFAESHSDELAASEPTT